MPAADALIATITWRCVMFKGWQSTGPPRIYSCLHGRHRADGGYILMRDTVTAARQLTCSFLPKGVSTHVPFGSVLWLLLFQVHCWYSQEIKQNNSVQCVRRGFDRLWRAAESLTSANLCSIFSYKLFPRQDGGWSVPLQDIIPSDCRNPIAFIGRTPQKVGPQSLDRVEPLSCANKT